MNDEISGVDGSPDPDGLAILTGALRVELAESIRNRDGLRALIKMCQAIMNEAGVSTRSGLP